METREPPRGFRRFQLLREWSHDEADEQQVSPEVRERAVRMVFDHQTEHGSQWATIMSIASRSAALPRRFAVGFAKLNATRASERA